MSGLQRVSRGPSLPPSKDVASWKGGPPSRHNMAAEFLASSPRAGSRELSETNTACWKPQEADHTTFLKDQVFIYEPGSTHSE